FVALPRNFECLVETFDGSGEYDAATTRAFAHDCELILLGKLSHLGDVFGIGAIELIEFVVGQAFVWQTFQHVGYVRKRSPWPQLNRDLKSFAPWSWPNRFGIRQIFLSYGHHLAISDTATRVPSHNASLQENRDNLPRIDEQGI